MPFDLARMWRARSQFIAPSFGYFEALRGIPVRWDLWKLPSVRSVAPDMALSTPTGRGVFRAASLGDKGVVLMLGSKEARTLPKN